MMRRPLAALLVLPLLVLWFGGLSGPATASPARIKDLVEVDGVRGNDLLGYGLVVGLNNSGDSLRNSPFTEDAIFNLLERLGVNVTGEQIRARNVAAVLVTASLPPFARAGSQIDVTVSAIGDARSLLGGTLVMTPLNAADGQIYAVAQGSIIAGGVVAEGEAESVTQGVPTSGLIPAGARVEREVAFDFTQMQDLRLALRNPDFTTAARIEAAINADLGERVARMLDAGTVRLDLAGFGIDRPALLMAQIENIEVMTSTRARVVVDQRSGTIILGSDVRISRVAVTQGNLTLRVEEAPLVVQPNPFADGETVVIPRTDASIEEDPGTGLALVEDSVSLPEVVAGLNALGVSARDMIDILKSIKAAGALHAEFIVQ
jgi:flagellar P-ring protein precursor FlgI